MKIIRGHDLTLVKDLYRYIWTVSARGQIILSALSIAVFLLELVPLELQRRIVNGAVEQRGLKFILMLCLVYVVVALLHGGLKLVLSVYRGSVSEAANQRLRMRIDPTTAGSATRERLGRKGRQGLDRRVGGRGGRRFRRLELLRSAAQCRHPGQRVRLHARRAAVDGARRAADLPSAAPVHSVPAERDQPADQAAHREAAGAFGRHRQRGRRRQRASARRGRSGAGSRTSIA